MVLSPFGLPFGVALQKPNHVLPGVLGPIYSMYPDSSTKCLALEKCPPWSGLPGLLPCFTVF
jgi:hypothetical protein